jgi:hypothetical protein
MTTHNKDINIPASIASQFPRLTRLINNDDINDEFTTSENIAKHSKLTFHTLGLCSLVFIILVLLITTWRFFLSTVDLQTPASVLWTSALFGLLSLTISLSSHFFGFQNKWLNNRFITERLRQWKFQQLLDGAFVALSQTNPMQFEQELKNRWAKARFDVLEEAGTLNDFVKAEDFTLFVQPSVCPNGKLAEDLREAYLILRLNYQAKYFSFKKDKLSTIDIWTNGIAKSSLLLAGCLALGEMLTLLVHDGIQGLSLSWAMGASALSAALLSAAIRVVRSARAISEESERYASKWVLLKILAERFRREKDPARRLECMVDTERVCIEELREFIRTFSKSDYLL